MFSFGSPKSPSISKYVLSNPAAHQSMYCLSSHGPLLGSGGGGLAIASGKGAQSSASGSSFMIAPNFPNSLPISTLAGAQSFTVDAIEVYSCKKIEHQSKSAQDAQTAAAAYGLAEPDVYGSDDEDGGDEDLSNYDEEEEEEEETEEEEPEDELEKKGGPKRALSAYVIFSNAKREEIKKQNPSMKTADIGPKSSKRGRNGRNAERRATEAVASLRLTRFAFCCCRFVTAIFFFSSLSPTHRRPVAFADFCPAFRL
jgi:hypothetical protein